MQLDEMGLAPVKPEYDNTNEEQWLNLFFKIFADSGVSCEDGTPENEPHVQLRHKLIIYISDNGSNFAQVII